MHGSFYLPDNRPLLIIDPFGHVLVDSSGNQIGWDGPVYTRADGTQLFVSPRNTGRSALMGRVEDTRGL